jgi:hypothetical protein
MEARIKELYETLGIAYKLPEKNNAGNYDIRTPYEKCGTTINIPITAGNSTIVYAPNILK